MMGMKQKRELDQTDLELIESLAADGRRAWSDLAEQVGLSAPAVADRIDRLLDQGVIRQFTIDVDRLKLQNRTPVLVQLHTRPVDTHDVYEQVLGLDGVENAFKLADGSILVHGNAPGDAPVQWLHDGLDMTLVEALDVNLIDQYERQLVLSRAEFSLPCVECGNIVSSEGITVELQGETVSFCCPSCQSEYESRLERYQAQSE